MRQAGRGSGIPGATALVVGLLLVGPFVAACGSTAPISAPTAPGATPGGTGTGSTDPEMSAPGTAAASTCHEPASGEATTVEATVADFQWSAVTARVGDVITWTNADIEPHAVETDDKSCRQENQIPGNGTGSLVFDVAGTYPFICWVHPTMKGTITVTE